MQKPHHQIMQARIQRSLEDKTTRENTRADFIHTLTSIGLSDKQACEEVELIFKKLSENRPLSEIEKEIFSRFSQLHIEDGSKTVTQSIDKKLSGRAEKIFGQIESYVQGVAGNVLDYGCGDGQVTQLIANALTRNEYQGQVHGVDVVNYLADHVTFPFSLLNGTEVNADPFAFELAILTNVLHHEADNDRILDQLDKLISKKLVIIETVPFGEGAEAEKNKDQTFMNDYFYNRLLHNPAIEVPVPGTYETFNGWVERLEKHGWVKKEKEDLGIDQETIKDRHVLYVFERREKIGDNSLA